MAGILLGKEFVILIARLDQPLKGRDCGEHSVQKSKVNLSRVATTIHD